MSAWVLVLLVALGAPERVTPPPELAEAIAAAAEGAPLPGAQGVERMAAILSVTAWREGRFKLDAIGDGGQSVGAFQISRYWRPGVTVDEQARKAAWLVAESFRVCAARPLSARLAWYLKGGAGCAAAGEEASGWRLGQAARLLRAYPPPPREEALAAAP